MALLVLHGSASCITVMVRLLPAAAHLWLLLLLEDVGSLDVALDVVQLYAHSTELATHVPAVASQGQVGDALVSWLTDARMCFDCLLH